MRRKLPNSFTSICFAETIQTIIYYYDIIIEACDEVTLALLSAPPIENSLYLTTANNPQSLYFCTCAKAFLEVCFANAIYCSMLWINTRCDINHFLRATAHVSSLKPAPDYGICGIWKCQTTEDAGLVSWVLFDWHNCSCTITPPTLK